MPNNRDIRASGNTHTPATAWTHGKIVRPHSVVRPGAILDSGRELETCCDVHELCRVWLIGAAGPQISERIQHREIASEIGPRNDRNTYETVPAGKPTLTGSHFQTRFYFM